MAGYELWAPYGRRGRESKINFCINSLQFLNFDLYKNVIIFFVIFVGVWSETTILAKRRRICRWCSLLSRISSQTSDDYQFFLIMIRWNVDFSWGCLGLLLLEKDRFSSYNFGVAFGLMSAYYNVIL